MYRDARTYRLVSDVRPLHTLGTAPVSEQSARSMLVRVDRAATVVGIVLLECLSQHASRVAAGFATRKSSRQCACALLDNCARQSKTAASAACVKFIMLLGVGRGFFLSSRSIQYDGGGSGAGSAACLCVVCLRPSCVLLLSTVCVCVCAWCWCGTPSTFGA
jgi:hypothetical protein